jgi:hypothetical protein
MTLPGWDSLDSVKTFGSYVRAVTLYFWALLVSFDVAAHFWKRCSRFFTVLAFVAFASAVAGELVQNMYDQRKEDLHDFREATLKGQLDKVTLQSEEEASKTVAMSLFTRAQNGDGAAFDQVVQMANDVNQSAELRSTARQVSDSIMETYSRLHPTIEGSFDRDVPLSEVLKHMRGSDKRKKSAAFGAIQQRMQEVEYRNSRPAGSALPSWRFPDKAYEELKPLTATLDTIFEVMTKDSDLKVRAEGYEIFEELAGAGRRSNPMIRALDNADAASWWHAHRSEYIP